MSGGGCQQGKCPLRPPAEGIFCTSDGCGRYLLYRSCLLPIFFPFLDLAATRFESQGHLTLSGFPKMRFSTSAETFSIKSCLSQGSQRHAARSKPFGKDISYNFLARSIGICWLLLEIKSLHCQHESTTKHVLCRANSSRSTAWGKTWIGMPRVRNM